LFRNEGGNRNRWLTIRLSGTKSNRDGIGSVIRVKSPLGSQSSTVHSGSSYCSASDLAATFGLGKDTSASVEIEWPSGTKQSIGKVDANQFLTIDETRGVIAREPPVRLPLNAKRSQ